MRAEIVLENQNGSSYDILAASAAAESLAAVALETRREHEQFEIKSET
jgi:hypothetical protein